ncbi:hypothetical protein V6N12_063770 [Hibiscus sabdariffa]|uniref:RRM domain-containing protein n=1 Tax=Hibiscus sabdariffa TaxID=183260 RepID=A0ABR2AUV4_9ROSI
MKRQGAHSGGSPLSSPPVIFKVIPGSFRHTREVLGVYIAYNNAKRADKKHIFAFVRFSNSEEAHRVVEKGNRRMDGLSIKIDSGSSDSLISDPDSCRFEDVDNCDNVGAVGDVLNLIENVVGSHANEHMEVDTNLNDHANMNIGSNDPQSVMENDSVGLVDIPVVHSIELAQVAESSKSSSGFSELTPPILHNKSGMFMMKPRCIKRDGSLDPKMIIEAPEALEYRPKEHVGTLVEIPASSKCVDVPDSNKFGEARLTIEVCNSLGLFFDAMIWRFARG